jgi:hypothetical protein
MVLGGKHGSKGWRVFAPAALSAALVVPAAATAHPNTTVPDVFVPVHVTITDKGMTLDRHTANRGDEVRFTIRNAGTKVHSFQLGATKPGQGKQVGFSTTPKPRAQKQYLVFLDYRGPLPYRSTIKTDLSKPKMHGVFKIN